MIRILIVEDILTTLNELVTLLLEVFPGAHIDRAGTVDKATDHLERCRSEGVTYDAVVLDFKLPQGMGCPPMVNTALCDKIRSHMPNVPVWHVTAYPEDREVTDHILLSHSSPDEPPFVLISKSKADWAITLVTGIERHFYSRILNQRLDDVFGAESNASRLRDRRQWRDGHLTHELRACSAEIEALWGKPLTDNVRRRVEKYFELPGPGQHFTLKPPDGAIR